MKNKIIKQFKFLKTFRNLFSAFLLISLIFPFTLVSAASASFNVSGGGSVNTGTNFTVTISVNGDTAYNAVSVNVNYSNLTYVSSSASSNWTPVSGPSNSGSNITFSGAVLGNSYTGSRNVLTITFRSPSSAGTSTIKPTGTIALADGNGTQVSGGGNTATYTVKVPPTSAPAPTATPTPKPAPGNVQVSSSSHPDQNSWYQTKDIVLTWNKNDGVTDFSYVLDQKSDTTPDDNSKGSDITKTFFNAGEGVNYFHIKAKNDIGWSGVTHYKINIDNSSPDPFTITKVNAADNSGFLLYFSTNDKYSGIKEYSVDVDGVKTIESSGFKINKNALKVTVTANDNAKNSIDSTLNVQDSPTQTLAVKSGETVVYKDNFGLVGIIFIILAVIFFIYGAVLTVLYWKKLK